MNWKSRVNQWSTWIGLLLLLLIFCYRMWDASQTRQAWKEYEDRGFVKGALVQYVLGNNKGVILQYTGKDTVEVAMINQDGSTTVERYLVYMLRLAN